jgi:hypothetical protein
MLPSNSSWSHTLYSLLKSWYDLLVKNTICETRYRINFDRILKAAKNENYFVSILKKVVAKSKGIVP